MKNKCIFAMLAHGQFSQLIISTKSACWGYLDDQQGINRSHQDNVTTRPLDLLTHVKEAGQEYGSSLQGSPFRRVPVEGDIHSDVVIV
jgi:hypothetical protein